MKHVIKVIWCCYIVFCCLLNLQIFANYGFVNLKLCKIRPVALEGESLKSQDDDMSAIFVETGNKKINKNVNRVKTYLNKLPSYLGIFISGIKYSNAVPDHDIRPLYLFSVVNVLLKLPQCFAGTSFLAIAIKLVCLASDANKS